MMSSDHTFPPKRWAEAAVSSMQQVRSFISAKQRKGRNGSRWKYYQRKTAKSRLSKENKEVKIRLYYDERGLDRYYGLLELGELGGLWKNVAGRYEVNGKKVYGKQILANPQEYFTDEVMARLEEIARENYSYG